MSDYIYYLIASSLVILVQSTPKKINSKDDNGDIGFGGLPAAVLPGGTASLALLALTRCVEVSYNELCRQLAFRSAGDMSSFDVMRLAYSLLTYIKASNAMAGTAGREIVQGNIEYERNLVGYFEQRIAPWAKNKSNLLYSPSIETKDRGHNRELQLDLPIGDC